MVKLQLNIKDQKLLSDITSDFDINQSHSDEELFALLDTILSEEAEKAQNNETELADKIGDLYDKIESQIPEN